MWLLAGLLLLFARTVLPCPPMCQSCSVDTAKCEQVSSLPEVLVGLSSYTEKILLRHGNLSKIPPQSFTKFYNLRFLSLTGFLVSSLTDLTFSTIHINSLRRLDLSNNHLLSCTIEPMAFSGLVFLKELILTNNSLDILRQSWFFEMPVLSKLFLGFNRIPYLAPRTFESLAKLKELDLSSNLIQYLPMDAFFGLPLLTKLDLSSNKILFINHEVFQPLQVLRYLLLFQNRLTILPVLPRSIIILFLHENPWDCSCQLANSMESLTTKIQTPSGVVCHNPPSLAGRQATSARPEGCTSPSSPSSSYSVPSSSSSSLSSSSSSSSSSYSAVNPSPSQRVHLWLLFGILGGLLVGTMLALLCCLCMPRCCPCIFRKWNRNCDPFAPRSCSLECTRPASKRPLFTLLEVDKATGEIRSKEWEGNERGMGVRSPSLNQWCCQRRKDNSQRMSENCGCVGACGIREQCFARGEHEFRLSPFQQATSHRTEGCAVMGKRIETCLDGQTTARLDSVQSPPALVHIDCRDGRAVRVEGERAIVCAASSKQNESWRGAVHVGAPYSRSGSFPNCYEADFASLRYGKDSAMRPWPKTSMKRRYPRHSAENREPPWRADTYSNNNLSLFHESNKKRKRTQLGHPSHLPVRDVTWGNSLSSTSNQTEDNGLSPTRSPYVEMLSIGHRPLNKGSFSQPFAYPPESTKTDLECRDMGNQRQDVGISSTRNPSTLERFWRCRKCGHKETHPGSGAACGTAGRMRSDAITQLPSSDTGCNVALTVLALHQAKAEKLRTDEPETSSWLPTFPPPASVTSSPGQRESDGEASYECPFGLVTATAALEIERSQQGTGTVSSLPEQTTPKLTDQKLDVRETAVERLVDTCSLKSVTIGLLEEDLFTTADPAEDPACTLGRHLVQGDPERISVSSSAVRFHSSVSLSVGSDETPSLLELSSNSRSKVAPLHIEGVELEESITFISSCPVVQKMCQVEFPLLLAEEEPNGL